jgi:hypothetical protein
MNLCHVPACDKSPRIVGIHDKESRDGTVRHPFVNTQLLSTAESKNSSKKRSHLVLQYLKKGKDRQTPKFNTENARRD